MSVDDKVDKDDPRELLKAAIAAAIHEAAVQGWANGRGNGKDRDGIKTMTAVIKKHGRNIQDLIDLLET